MTKLVIVDDHEALREGLVAMLRGHGHGGRRHGGQRRGRRSTSSSTPSPTSRSSTSACPTAAASSSRASCSPRRPDLGVILYTGDADAELLYSGLDSGARGYALKAGSMEELVGAIEHDRRRRLVRRPAPGPHPALAARDRAACPQLSPREREIMHLMAEGGTAEAIGDRARRLGRDRAHPRAQRHPQAAGAQPRARDRASRSSAARSRSTRRRGRSERWPTTSCARSSTTCARR